MKWPQASPQNYVIKKNKPFLYEKSSAFSPASQQNTAAEYYVQTSIGLNKVIEFFYE